jgi:YHS domain-containing protein
MESMSSRHFTDRPIATILARSKSAKDPIMRIQLSLAVAALAASGIAAQPAAAKTAPIYTGLFNNIAVSGYDPVAYFTAGKPVKGSAAHKISYKGAEFHFASAENLAKFRANPAAFAPQYGGYCAWAVSQGYTASGDPMVWKIVGGKLYLNYNREVGDRWSKNIASFIKAGDANWPKLLAK